MNKILKQLLFIQSISFFIISCNPYPTNIERALNYAGDNKQELIKVLEHYNGNPKDSLKYKAALFLIENISYHSFYEPIKEFNFAFDSIEKYSRNNNSLRIKFFLKMLDSVSKNNKAFVKERIFDVEYLKADFLIENIELAFQSWYQIPENKRVSFLDFCNYTLPYRSSTEPIEFGMRKKLAKQYYWAYNLLKNGATLKSVVDSVTGNMRLSNIQRITNHYQVPFSLSQIEKSKMGICDDIVNYYVNVFRALGLASSKDMIPHWGNHHSTGHSWIYVKHGNEEYSTDIRGRVDNKQKYNEASVPKVYRVTYSFQDDNILFPKTIDVTQEYVPTVDLDIENIFGQSNTQPVLSVFDVRMEWSPIVLGKENKDSFHYSKIGLNVLYMPGSLDKGVVTPSNYPFFIDEYRKQHFFRPEKNQIIDAVRITRKYGFSSPINRSKIKWIRAFNGSFFEVSNTADFKNSKIIYRIKDLRSTNLNLIKIKGLYKAKYIRFNSNGNNCFLAEMAFYDEDGDELKGEIIQDNTTHPMREDAAFDKNPLSFSGGKDFSLGLQFDNSKSIGFIEFQARNDDNHINVGEDYELFYWDKRWNSLGIQEAKDTVLYYDVPKNSLLWLKNLTKGKEEHVFTIDKNKQQKWLGFDNNPFELEFD